MLMVIFFSCGHRGTAVDESQESTAHQTIDAAKENAEALKEKAGQWKNYANQTAESATESSESWTDWAKDKLSSIDGYVTISLFTLLCVVLFLGLFYIYKLIFTL